MEIAALIVAILSMLVAIYFSLAQRKDSTKPLVFVKCNNQYKSSYVYDSNDILPRDYDIDLCVLGNGIATHVSLVSHVCFSNGITEFSSFNINNGLMTKDNTAVIIRPVELHFDALGISETNNIGNHSYSYNSFFEMKAEFIIASTNGRCSFGLKCHAISEKQYNELFKLVQQQNLHRTN